LKELAEIDPLKALENEVPVSVEQLKRAVITAPKGHIGHTFCAAGAIESVFAIQSIKHGLVP
jgi:3-oxoacyl-(acyl-carrier-protein) synthase